MKLIALHHRLSTFGGHRYNEALGLIDESSRRGWELDLLVSAHASDAVLRRLAPFARPVLDDPTFDFTRTFEQRVDEFVRQLRVYAEPALTANSRVLVTVATQCEACALARWARILPSGAGPSIFVLFLSDRWNRAGARTDEPMEIETAGNELARLEPAIRERFVLCATTAELAAELSSRLRTHVAPVPAQLNYGGLGEAARRRPMRSVGHRPVLGLLGGSRAEKGSHVIADIISACRVRTPVRFVVQAFNEGLDPVAFERLQSLRADPDVTLIDGPLDRGEYERLLSELDVLLYPYERINYRQRNSGIFCEGVAAGLPAVVPSRTWMADQVDAGRAAGVVYDRDGPDAVADAVARCAQDLAALTRAAEALAAPWRETQSLGACLDAMERSGAL
jgi:glycosyltransferase involved in cell wall biosynthesis